MRTEPCIDIDEPARQFSRMISHELKGSLNTVVGAARLLSDRFGGKFSADGDELIGWILESATLLTEQVDALTLYVRAATDPFSFLRTDCAGAAEEALAQVRDSGAETSGVTLGPLPSLQGADPAWVRQLFLQLLDNALKFHLPRTVPRVYVSALRQGREWIFTVRDNGIGFDPKYGEEVFKPFRRLNSRVQFPGVGMGLAIGAKIVERHGGRLWAESQPGSGSAFHFSLPGLESGAGG